MGEGGAWREGVLLALTLDYASNLTTSPQHPVPGLHRPHLEGEIHLPSLLAPSHILSIILF